MMTLDVGTKLGRYTIVSLIGVGGMGEVYLAEDIRLHRKVALKILPENIATNKERLLRFEREAQAASALNHPNIITIHEIGETGDQLFIATEYIEGETLRQKIEKNDLSVYESVRIAEQIAAALSVAHQAHIIHRDIKPGNIMIRSDGYVKILDFGLAKLVEKDPTPLDAEAETRAQVNTKAGMIMGTVAYMSPEQARGKDVGERTDVWSLGVCLYEMLIGRQPFTGETTSDTIAAILTKEPKPLDENLPSELQRIVRKTLQKDADKRYQTAKDLLIDLEEVKEELKFQSKLERTAPPNRDEAKTQILNATTTDVAQTTSSAEYVANEIKSQKSLFAIGLIILLLASIGLGYWYFTGRSTKQIESIAVMPFANVSGDPNTEYLSDGLTESLIDRLSQLPNLKVMSRSSVFRYKGKDADAQQAARVLNVEAVLMGQVTQHDDDLTINAELVDARDNSRLWGGRYNRKIADILTVQQDITREISESLRLKLTGEEQRQIARRSSENPEAYQLYLRGRYFWNKRTEEGLRKSIEYYEQAMKSDPNYALAYVGASDSYGMTTVTAGTFPPTEAALKAKEAALRALEIDDTLAEAHVSLARVKMNFDWDWSGAEREFRRAIELNPNYAEAHHMYAHYLLAMRRMAEAFAESKRYLELEPLSVPANNHLGWHYLYTRQYDEALAQLRKTAELDPNFISMLVYLGWVYEQKRMYAEAIATFQRPVELSTSPLMLASLGHAYAAAGKRDEAQKILVQLDDLSKQRYVSAYDRAVIYVGLNESEQALAWLERAYQERSQFLIYLDTDPRFDSFRTNLRFQDLLRRLRFPSQGD